MTQMTADDIDAIATKFPNAFKPRLWKRYAGFVGLAAGLLYTAYCWWFFSMGAVLGGANWKLAATYLSDWVSYEIRPNIEIEPNYLNIRYSRFSPLGENPDPDWLQKDVETVTIMPEAAAAPAAGGNATSVQSSSGSFVAPSMANVGTTTQDQPAEVTEPAEPWKSDEVVKATVDFGGWILTVTPTLATVERNGEVYHFAIDRKVAVTPAEPLQSWAEQRREGSTVYLTFGWTGRAEIQDDEVVVWNRFFGWKNFVFDPTSQFWGRSATEVIGLIFSGSRLDPAMSNWRLAWHDIWFNQDWQHGDVWTKLLQTIVMAFAGTLLASIIAFPLAFLAARNITPNRFANQALKRFFDFQRSVDMLIWALFFTRAFGPGPLAGISAIFFTDTGTLGKLYSEALENIDDKQREGIRSVGAAPVAVQRFGVVPQVLPVFASQALYFWESNTRSATIIGAVGAGGIGLKLWEAMRTNQNWENVFYMVILILIVVFVFDSISSSLRARLVGGER